MPLKREATHEHPFGFGRARYLAAFVVSIMLFSLGGLFALFESYEKIKEATGPDPSHPSTADKWWWVPIAVILVSIVMEGASFRTAWRQASSTRGSRTMLQYVRAAKDPEVPVVLLEDSAAVAGLVFALFGVCMSLITQNGVWDGIGAGLIGLLLIAVAVVLGREMQSLLVGESASPRVVATLREQLELAFEAHQRRPSAGAETTPATTSRSTISPIRVAHTGTPRTKFEVPSIGSITQRRAPRPVSSNSSPCTASRGLARDRVRRRESSTAVSASVTWDRSGLAETFRSCALNRAIVIESALSASRCASRTSSV